jgi:hypothetical protein
MFREDTFYHEDTALDDYLDTKEIQVFDDEEYPANMPRETSFSVLCKYGKKQSLRAVSLDGRNHGPMPALIRAIRK